MPVAPVSAKWISLLMLTAAELLIMSLWFSGSAVLPQLTQAWELSDTQRAWMTMSVQLGFVVGAVLSAVLNLSDRVPPTRLIPVSALAGAAATAAIALASSGFYSAVVLRFVTGVTLAGVYPPGMKLVASWTVRDRGLAIGLLVGGLSVGSALPHLVNATTGLASAGMPAWEQVMLICAALSAVGAAMVTLVVRQGPHLPHTAPFAWRQAAEGFRNPSLRLANLGYIGHMWELYAMWTWAPIFLLASYAAADLSPVAARWAAFAAVASGGASCLLAGIWADRAGRTRVAGISLAVSGTCCLVVGLCFPHPLLATVLCVVWGFAAIADSAQFSAAISELADSSYVGTALTMQTSMGFLITMLSIAAVPRLVTAWGWTAAFALLALGPAIGVWAMVRLRARADATRMAGGNR